MRTVFRILGQLALSLAAMTFIAAASLFVVGAFLTTWPIMRLSPRDRRVKATIDLATAGIGFARAVAGNRLFAASANSQETEN